MITFEDVDDLVEKIKWLLSDNDARRRLEEGAKKYAEEHSWEKVAEKHKSLFEKIVKR